MHTAMTNAANVANAANAADTLSLADLETYDPSPIVSGPERRYLCLECGDGKPRDAKHRCLKANTQSGAYMCHRCGLSGKLRDFWQDRPEYGVKYQQSGQSCANRGTNRGQWRRARRASVPPIEAAPVPDRGAPWREQLRGAAKLNHASAKPGASYLAGRGVSLEIAKVSSVIYAPRWYGRASIVFPIRHQSGALVAAQGRAIESADKLTGGPKSQGIFSAHSIVAERLFCATDKRLPALILTEAPIDALSLATCGFPALALCGTSGPAWLHRICGLRRVLLATDADEAGDKAACDLSSKISPFGAQCERLRPEGAKDWNALLLEIGAPALSDWLAARQLR